MQKKQLRKKNKRLMAGVLLLCFSFLIATSTVMAIDTEEITSILKQNRDLFHSNSIIATMFRYIGWQCIRGLVWVAENCAKLFDQSFKLIDFTSYGPVETFINSWRPVFFALISLSILFLGLILVFWQEKKPKLAMNICLAILIVTSSGYLIDQLNGFVTEDMRNAIINDENAASGTQELIYDMVASTVYDLVYLDDKLEGGLMKLTTDNRVTYDNFTKEDLDLLNINEIVKPDDVKAESKDLMSNRIYYRKDDLELKEIYNGVAWTDLLNEYHYRYDVAWFTAILGLFSMILVYLCLAYKVVRILYEIVVQRLLAVLYAANLTNSQKTLKILDSIKDSYITLILVMICLKIYLLAFKMIGENGFGAFSKNMILLFVAFAVIDGPNIIQKLTGVDAGLSSGMGKIIAGMQASRMMSMMLHHGNYGGHSMFSGQENHNGQDISSTSQNNVDLEGDKMAQGTVPPEKGTEKTSSTSNEQNAFATNIGNDEMTSNPDISQEGAASEEDTGYREESTEDVSFSSATAAAAMDDFRSEAMNDLNGMDPMSGKNSLENGMERMNRELAEHKGNRPQSGLGEAAAVKHEGSFFRSEWKEQLERPTASSISRSDLESK